MGNAISFSLMYNCTRAARICKEREYELRDKLLKELKQTKQKID